MKRSIRCKLWAMLSFAICICLSSTLVQNVSYAANALVNPGFETGTASGWTIYGGGSVVYGGYNGHYSAKHAGLAGLEQTVSGLTSNTTYKVQAWVRSDGTNAIVIGAKDFGGVQVADYTTNAEWTKISVNFTTGASDTTAKIFSYLDSGTAYVDNFSVYSTAGQTLSLHSPSNDQTVSGNHSITWSAGGDWSDDTLTIEFTTDAIPDNDTVWFPLAVHIDPDLQTYSWDTSQVSDLMGDDITTCRIRIKASDGTPTVMSGTFTVNNYGSGTPVISVATPGDSDTLSGITSITWTAGGNWAGKSINIYYTPNGTDWYPIASGLSPLLGTYTLDTTRFSNGTWNYLSVNDETFAIYDMVSNVTISNSTGIRLNSPSTNERWSGIEEIRWNATGDWTGKTVTIDYSPNGGANWYNIATGLSPSTGSYSWNTEEATTSYGPNAAYQIRVRDNTATFSDVSGNMVVDNSKIGTRSYDMGFSEFPYDRTLAAQKIKNEYLNNHGNLTGIWEDGSLPWVEALTSSDPGDFPQGFQDYWEAKKNEMIGDSENKIFYSINPGRGGKLAKYWGEFSNMDLPAPWGTYSFDSADTIAAYTNIIRAAIAYFGTDKVAYVAIGFEIDLIYDSAQGIAGWNKYMKLQKKVYETLKSEYPDIIFLSTVTGPKMHQPKYELLLAGLFNYSDAWGFSTYPYGGEPYTDSYTSVGDQYPSNYYDDFIDMAAKYGKKAAVGESGYTHENLFAPTWNIYSVSDEALQNYHTNRILKDFNEGDALFVVSFASIDLDPFWREEPDGLTKDQYHFWRDIGFRDFNNQTGVWTTYDSELTWDEWLSKPLRYSTDMTPPSNIADFNASEAQQGQITLSWTKPHDADVVKILRKSGSYSSHHTDGEVVYVGPGSSYEDIAVSQGVAYYYTAWARDASMNWSNGNAAGARDTGSANGDTAPPEDVSGFSASDYRYGVLLHWTNPTDDDFVQVKIMRKTGSYSTSSSDGTLIYQGSAGSYLDTSVAAGTTYYYSAWATDETGANWSAGTVSGARDTGVGGTELFSDDFESGNLSKWDGSGAADWEVIWNEYRSGASSVWAGPSQTNLISDPVDTSGASRVTVRFYYRNHGLDSGDNVTLYFYNGTAYVGMANIGGHSADKYQWNYLEVTTTDSQFFVNNFNIKIDATTIPAGKSIYIDDLGVDAQ